MIRGEQERKKLIKLIIKYLYDSQVKVRAHTTAETKNRKRERVSSWTQSLLSLVVGVTGVSAWNKVDSGGKSTNTVLIATGVLLSFISAAIGATRSAWKFASKEQWHHSCASNFADIASDIEHFLTGQLDDVERLRDFADIIHEKLDERLGKEAPLSDSAIARAKERVPYPKNGLFNPLASGVLPSVSEDLELGVIEVDDSESE